MKKVQALRKKLRWLGIPVDGPTYMFYNNESVVKSKYRAEITLSKKHQLISWHSVRDAISAGWLRVLKEPGETNLADVFTKQSPIQRWEDILNSIYSCNDKSVRYEELYGL